MAARTGDKFIADLKRRNRDLWLGDERVEDVTAHPALAGGARTMAELFDLQHDYAEDCLFPDPETGELINVSHLIPRSKDDLRRRRAGLERIHRYTLGHMGRSPDYNSVCFAGFAGHWRIWAGEDGRNAEGAHNLIEYQKYMRRADLSTTHTLIHPTIDKSREQLIAGTEHGLHKVGETSDAIILKGARVLATLAPYADELVVWTGHPISQHDAEPYALSFAVPMDAPGLTFLCRDSTVHPQAGAFDQPLSSRFDEQDAFAIFDNVAVPKNRVFNDGHIGIYNSVAHTGFFPNMQQQTTIRALAKLEFAYGLGAQLAELINDRSEGTQEMLGEILCYIEMTRSALLLSEEHAFDHGDGIFFPDARPLHPMRAMMTQWIPRAMEIVSLIGSHNLLITPSRAMLDDDTLRPKIDRYIAAANDAGADRRAALFRLAWDFVGSGLAGRQELYERFYIGSGRSNRKSMHMMESAPAAPNAYGKTQKADTGMPGVREGANAMIDSILQRS